MGIRKVIANVAGLSGCVLVAYSEHGTMRGMDCSPTVGYCAPGADHTPLMIGGILVAVISGIAGARLVFPLIFGAVGVGSLIAGVQNHDQASFPLIFGGIFTAVSIMALAMMLAWMLFARSMRNKAAEGTERLMQARNKAAEETERLMQTGIPAVGTIVSIRDTGGSINDNPVVRLGVRIEPTNGMPGCEGEKTVMMSRVQPFHVDQRLPALIDPEDTSRFILLTDITDPSQLPPHLTELLHSVQAGPPTNDLAGQLGKLDDLRRSGALSDQEFTAAKARLIGH